ncbi:hypothetical protein KQ3_05882 [Bacillus cereus B5-2]|uniref:hypothetical protein n=1 Tax=Bacillus wiedmannii TaxID=1890302 RepID=UPI00032D6CC9|nr:hypothetical protein [Bacillus wiedmannii]EOQ15413.1 hypothetical protein KQ3_05882 [Bacillus cereus B5-2]PHE75147.1 hypothetical protein COF77_15295 [Bacillus wiedmannii]
MGISYWNPIAEQKELDSMKKPCSDCAIVTGFYVEYADDLLKQPIEVQEKAKKRWFCHNHTNRCCKGLEDYMNEKRRQNPDKKGD